LASLTFQVELAADAVGFAHELLELSIQRVERTQFEVMHVVAGADGVDFREARIFDASREYEMTGESVALQVDSGKAHAHLKGDARFLRKDRETATAAGHSFEGAIDSDHLRAFAAQTIPQLMASTEVRLIAIGEASAARFATPHAP
jgi:hypothetical protein